MRAIKNLVQAEVADSWKGGGKPEDMPLIENRLKRAQYHMLRTINELAELKEVKMRTNLRGHILPESEEEYKKLLALDLLQFMTCSLCNKSHLGRTNTLMGWRETQISGYCEGCWNELMKPFTEEGDDDDSTR
jgi:hypothetical protein